ncbi:MAG TPA: M20/M25/M40 family metallo-hydrolase [Miltoncostaeaceae bacterium]|nr:M20/M25/M40 family metallo-hydrolase [Miltoncostaeaceae bacterium]
MTTTAIAALPEVARLTAALCEIPSPAGQEGAIAEVVRTELRQLGMEVTEDDAAERIPAGCGNILGRLAPTAPGTPVMFCAHLDTVPVAGEIDVVVTDEGDLTNRHPAILGGDNKAAVAAILVALRQVVAEGLPHAGIEVLFTPCEEISLRGSSLFDVARLSSALGFVYDHSGPVGGVVGAAPTHSRITATFRGRAAHAGLHPEDGRSAILAAAAAVTAMPLGRIDAATTANVGRIAGGVATNVVAPTCTLVAEARSRDPRALSDQVTAMLDALTEAASAHECDVESRVETMYHGYRLSERDPQVDMAMRALRRAGHTPRLVPSGGGSDVNALLRKGFPCANLCNAMTDVHTADERIAVRDLEAMVDVTLAILAEARAA